MESVLDIYVDGSYSNGQTKWAFIVVEDDAVIHSNSGVITDPVICEGRQVGGEIQAVIECVEWAKQNKTKINIFYDFANLRHWVSDIWGEKPWKTTKNYTNDYRNFMLRNRSFICKMIKIKSHTGNKYNTLVDELVGAK